MDRSLANNADQPYGGQSKIMVVENEDDQHCVVNWAKVLFLIFFTFALIVAMWFTSQAIQTMTDGSVYDSWIDGGGLILGLFCFYVICFAAAWIWGFRQRDEMRRQVVEKEIARQKAEEAMMNMED